MKLTTKLIGLERSADAQSREGTRMGVETKSNTASIAVDSRLIAERRHTKLSE
jgi:hypothetical protein